MKKLLALIVLLALLVPAAFGEETYPKASYTLTETSLDLANVSVYAHRDIMEEYGLGTPRTDNKLQHLGLYKDVIGNEPLVPLYASENMDTIVFQSLACLRNGKLIIPAANPNRGAGDPNRSLERLSRSKSFPLLRTPNGLILSPDGKYAAYVDSYRALVERNYNYQLIILDVESGEYFLGQTWDVKMGKDKKVACVVEAAFDKNSEYLYYVTYGNQNKYRCSLYRYHLATGKNELLLNHPEEVYFPNLTFLSSSRLVAPMAVRDSDEFCGILVYNKKFLRGWEAAAYSIPVNRRTAYVRRLQASAESELALAAVEFNVSYSSSIESYKPTFVGSMLSVIDIQKDPVGLDRILVFDEEALSCESVTYEEFLTGERFTDTKFILNYPSLYNACLTPDGAHALTVHRVGDEFALRLLNLKTLEVKTVEAPEDFDGVFASFNTGMSADYPLGVNMLSDTLVVINTSDGVKLYELK